MEEPLILVCAHGKRDQCCALLGRPIAAGLSDLYPDRVWECSHTGGHRFAPAVVLLPTGLTYGRMDGDSAIAMVEAADRGEVSLTGFRGRSCYTPAEQIAEVTVRQEIGDETYTRRATDGNAQPIAGDADPGAGIDDLTVELTEIGSATVEDHATFAGAATVTHRDGRRWLVTTRSVAYAPRQASCGASPKPATAVVADQIHPLH